MRIFMLLLLSVAAPVTALADLVPFDGIQSECVTKIHGVSINCRVSKAGWYSTIGLNDLYQAQYCHEPDGQGCAQRSLHLFANRAYTPVARRLFSRVDPGDTAYDPPQVFLTPQGEVLRLGVRHAGGAAQPTFYLWRDDTWHPIETRFWRRDLARRLPHGLVLAEDVEPDFETLGLDAELWRKSPAGLSAAGHAKLRFGFEGTRLVLKSVRIVQETAKR